jgi:hypothetical protein
MLIAAGCVDPPAMSEAPAVTPPVPAGQARIWFYRDWEPSESLNLANIDVNGSYFGSVANGGVFYRDVSPGHYHITPQSYGQDFNQDRDVDLASGQQVYCSVVSLRSWEAATWRCSSGTRSISGWCHARRHRPQSSGTAMVSEGLVRGEWQQHEGLELRRKTARTLIDGEKAKV